MLHCDPRESYLSNVFLFIDAANIIQAMCMAARKQPEADSHDRKNEAPPRPVMFDLIPGEHLQNDGSDIVL